jgi:hypothetical protein
MGVAEQHGYKPSDRQVSEFLWNCTCFPFGAPEQVRENVVEAFGWLDDAGKPEDFADFLMYAIGRCEREMAEQMRQYQEKSP